jgi:uncharacterized OB-fold protein
MTQPCSRCGYANPPTARFCVECGQALVQTCANCGAGLTPGARFCGACGASQAAPAPVPAQGEPLAAPAAPPPAEPGPAEPGLFRGHAGSVISM